MRLNSSISSGRLLLHICCAPCVIHTFSELRKDFKEVFAFWYNPNIHPFLEYQRRLGAVRIWVEREKVRILYKDDYGLKGFLRQVVYREEERCRVCYHMRLKMTAMVARKGNFHYFSSTLLLSPHQDKQLLEEIMREVGKEHSVRPYLEEVQGGWRKGMDLAREMGLYRQQYCGCIYSEGERYRRSKGARGKPKHL